MSTTAARDPYEVLGVPRDADDAAIKKAFRRAARDVHPDTNPDDPSAEAKFKEVGEAYGILSDPDKRATFDRYGHDGLRQSGMQGGGGFEGFSSLGDIFEAVFGGAGGRGGPRPGADVAVDASITLAQAYAGATVTTRTEVVGRCETCHGNGAKPGTPISTCRQCGGQGVVEGVQRTPFGQMVRRMACPTCQGDGKIPEQPCETCDGQGLQQRTQELDVDVPAGIADGQRIRLSGKGHTGEPGAPSGDLYVVVTVEQDQRFLRDGADLVTPVRVSAPTAALGTTVTVEGLDGDLEIEVPAGTQPGATIQMRGRGMPVLGRAGRRGDVHAIVDVRVPRDLSERQRELLAELAGSLDDAQVDDRGESLRGKLRRLWKRG